MDEQIKDPLSTNPRSRTKEQTKLLLLEAVGEIIKTKGYAALTENRIAMQAEVSQHLICEYFETPENLVERYVRMQDYWIENRNRLIELHLDNIGNLRNYVKAIFEYHFRFFDKDEEMQKIIIADFTEELPLMQNILSARMSMATPFLVLTDDYFKNSSLDFRIISIMLMSWQNLLIVRSKVELNKWTFMGFNPASKEDRDPMVQAVLLIIDHAFEKVEEEKIRNK